MKLGNNDVVIKTQEGDDGEVEVCFHSLKSNGRKVGGRIVIFVKPADWNYGVTFHDDSKVKVLKGQASIKVGDNDPVELGEGEELDFEHGRKTIVTAKAGVVLFVLC